MYPVTVWTLPYKTVFSALLDSAQVGLFFLAGITLASYAPLFTFGSASTLIGLEGDAITLRVFFSGRYMYVQVVLTLMQSVIGDEKFYRSQI